MRMGFDYIKVNKGIDSEDDYPFTGANGQCWTAAAKRVVATIDSFTAVTTGSETALVAAVALGPVSVAIEADQPAFQHYKSGVFDAPCGTKLDHGVLVVGYDADTYTVKNRHEPLSSHCISALVRTDLWSDACGCNSNGHSFNVASFCSHSTAVGGQPGVFLYIHFHLVPLCEREPD
jgi:hypothetical protein